MSVSEQTSLDVQIKEELCKGYILHLDSEMTAPFFFIKKADSRLRLCMDYRMLNKVTIKNQYSISRISDLIDALSKTSIFTKIDLKQSYNNVRIHKGNE